MKIVIYRQRINVSRKNFIVKNSNFECNTIFFRVPEYNDPKNFDYEDYSNQLPHVIAQKSVDGAPGREII